MTVAADDEADARYAADLHGGEAVHDRGRWGVRLEGTALRCFLALPDEEPHRG
jgi:hypothetical protein